MNLIDLFENISAQQRRVGQLPANFRPPQTSPQLSGPYPGRNATQGYLVGEGKDDVDSLVTDTEAVMKKFQIDAEQALKIVLGDREYNSRRSFYSFYIRQIIARAGQQGVAEGGEDRSRLIHFNTWTVMDGDEEVMKHSVERDPFFSAKKFIRQLDDEGYEFTHVVSPEGRITYLPQHDPRHLKNFPGQGVAEGKSNYNFDIEDLKRLERIRDLPTLKAQALALISKPSTKPMKPEKVEWFKNALENMNSPIKVIKLMYDLMLSGEGHAVVGSTASMNPNSYRRTFGEQGVSEIIDYDTLNQLGSHPMAAPLVAAGGAAIGGVIGGGIKKTVDYFQKKKEQKAQAQRLQQQGVAESVADNNPMAAAVVRRILRGRLDLLQKYGAEAVLQAVEDVTDGDTDWEEIGSSDVSAYVKYVEQQLQDRMGSREEMNEAATTTEDVLSAMKKKLSDYLQNAVTAIKADPTLKDKLSNNTDLVKAVKTIRTDDGHEIKINGNEDDGFRISIRNREMATPFKTLDEAVMASEMYCARRRTQALEADYMEEN